MNCEELFVEGELPNALRKQELLDCFQKYKAGDQTMREVLINTNIRLVISRVMKRFNKTPYEQQELISVGIIGLIKSVETFDPTKKISFATYATKCIDNEILYFIRKEKKYIDVDSLNKKLSIAGNENEITLEDTLCDESTDLVFEYEEKELYWRSRLILESLPKRERTIVMLYLGFVNDEALTQEEIAKRFGISQGYISRIINKSLKKIRTLLEYENPYKSVLEERTKEPVKPKLTSISEYCEQYREDQSEPIFQDKINQPETQHVISEKSNLVLSMPDVKIDNIESLPILKIPNLECLIATYPTKEAIILFLKLGYLGRNFDIRSIAQFLRIEPHEVREVVKDFLLSYKEMMLQIMDIVIQDPIVEKGEENKQK